VQTLLKGSARAKRQAARAGAPGASASAHAEDRCKPFSTSAFSSRTLEETNMKSRPLAAISILSLSTLAACGGSYAKYSMSPAASRAEMAPAPSYPIQAADTAVAAPLPAVQGTEDYKDYGVNPMTDTAKDHLSTFAIDVDTASYAISRRKIMEGGLPPYQAVRAEEFLNYFDYGYPGPSGKEPFAVHFAAAPSPFAQGHHLVRVAVQGRRIPEVERKPVHLVYLVDTSGSMQSDDKIGLIKKSLRMLTNTLRQGDTVALCTYAGSVREFLSPTGVGDKGRILSAIDDLSAGGSTAMASGIDIAYRMAERTRVPGHVNRVIVLSDGDANVGATSHEQILDMISRYKDQGITLSTVGFGDGNYKDTMMEQLADKGNGNYTYIDSEKQARRVFVDQLSGMLEVIARDVKIQVDFEPQVVKQYRLVGYENRDVADKDFRNDKVDGGEVGAGHSVTAIYDVVLESASVSPLTVRIRHKAPEGSDQASENAYRMDTQAIYASFDAAPQSFRFAASVTGFAEILRQSPYVKGTTMADVEKLARAAASNKEDQQELIELTRRAAALSGQAIAQVAQ